LSYTIHYGPGVERQLARLPRAVLLRIDRAILSLAEKARPHGCKKLAGHAALYRIRVGDWRIAYESTMRAGLFLC
jgi:mRNA interferase RelE/StbE